MKIAVVGTGYVGLVTGTCLAETGNYVTCVDIDTDKVKKMKAGIVPIYEPGLETLFDRNIKHERLFFTTDLEKAVSGAKIIFLALPTPPGGDGSADLSYVLNVAEELGKIITEYKIIVDKSTVPVGTADLVRETIAKNATCEFDVVSNPEFLREGYAIEDFMKPDRIVIGTSSEKAKKLMDQLYHPYVRQGNPIYFMDERSAELTKYAANSFLATKISFMNEIANISEKLGADVDQVRMAMGADERIGKRFLFPGIGYGGSCFPKDVQALVKTSEDIDYDFKILKSVMEVNQRQKLVITNKLLEYFNNNIEGKIIALWGLSFKPNTDDIRDAPSLEIIKELIKKGAVIKAYDPEAMNNVRKEVGDQVSYMLDMYDCLPEADALVIATEWSAFRNPDFEKISNSMKHKVIFDGRNVFELEQMEEYDFDYFSIGRSEIRKK